MEHWREELYTNELYHHGVKGMKWGVRRYQNYDGSYTREGVRRFNETAKKYDSANSNYKDLRKKKRQGLTSKTEVSKAKKESQRLKRILTAEYKQLRKDKRADKGKALYSEGHRITSNHNKLAAGYSVASGTAFASAYLLKNGYKNLAAGAALVSLGSGFVTSIASAKYEMDNRNLQAYYGHSRPRHV